uniref:Uncharacterized protein n=1 Tax=Anguilla anguilla TaxID=7936 RepID=A0A0E9T425_ANGAN
MLLFIKSATDSTLLKTAEKDSEEIFRGKPMSHCERAGTCFNKCFT